MIVQTVRTRLGNREVKVVSLPDKCPHCHLGLVPEYIFGYVNKSFLYLSFNCPRESCLGYFLVVYQADHNSHYHIDCYVFGSPEPVKHPQIINTISPSFVDLYRQAQSSQDYGLNDVCGMGFRKALEFLIKDYIVFKDPLQKSTIEKKLLGPCIKDHIDSQKIKDIANRAAWLGNDETHYVRKWVNMDVNNLKQLIQLTTHWIETEYLTDQMIQAMP
ncbi:protein of unknown function [Mucilaginibacter lappiensis]|uniref:DUF4145 domain-containing protein n=1 Tax=Mucilaginibacter lappiensis TaxID=354630 RepID=A0ABR6PIX7_9SPHI|nr:DUF4145 domain-containing protein [Mucilaginibacter lappiensis]MBB6109730.1 hypothetical protein [Mucilaginibacter lappiensis]SIR13433.1 protein of unknown function [Mucilaginibacter lappiensis]